METSLVIDTLNKVVKTSGVAEGLILHSDLGSQYTSEEYEKRLKS
jgi:transposase InsO family protein